VTDQLIDRCPRQHRVRGRGRFSRPSRRERVEEEGLHVAT